MSGEEDKQEIIIVKRGGGGGDGHHGGAWKIAFADFMTAMMALFLVLWLVNAANEKTKKSVASYFNPVKLVDRTRSTRGLDEATSADLPKNTQEDEEEDEDSKPSGSAEVSQFTVNEEDFFKDPFAVLDEIASSEQAKIKAALNIREEIYEATSDQDDAFMDPFAEVTPPPQPNEPEIRSLTELASDNTPRPVEQQSEAQVVGEKPPVEEGKSLESVLVPASLKVEPEEDPSQVDVNKAQKPEGDQGKTELEAKEKEQAEEKKELASKEIREEIKERLAEKLGQADQVSESLSVQATEDGVLISITDQFGFSMFQVGSAVPKGEIVLAMEEISNVLAERKGKVRVYGHTDGRPYAGDNYDNWRLSTARAHAARLMLGRGGLAEARVSQVVGFSDRILRTPDDPEADENRRIEILLEVL